MTKILKHIILALILYFYIWTATSGRFEFNFDYSKPNLYNKLTDAFVHGHMYLFQKPPEELLKTPNPYHPMHSFQYREMGLHDLSLYKRKFYLYYGPTPVILLYLPYYLFTLNRIPDNLAVLTFLFLSLIVSVELLYYIKKKYFGNIPEHLMLISIGLLGFATLSPYLLRRPIMYEVAISCASFLLLLAVNFFCKALHQDRFMLLFLVLGSLSLGLANGARPHFILVGIILIFFLCVLLGKNKEFPSKSVCICLFVPFIACLILLFSYNYFRFEDIREFGLRYQLSRVGMGIELRPHRMHLNLYNYLFVKPIFRPPFPFVHANVWDATYYPKPYEKILGLFPCIPFITILLFGFLYLVFRRYLSSKYSVKDDIEFPTKEFQVILLPGIIIFIFLILFGFVTLRYVADYIVFFILSACLIMFYFYKLFKNQKLLKSGLLAFVYITAIYSMLVGVAISIRGPVYGLEFDNPAEFRKIESYFQPLSDTWNKYLENEFSE